MGSPNDPVVTPPPAPTPPPEREPSAEHDAEYWKKHARTWEERAKANADTAKANADAAARLKEIEDAGRSEVDKANQRAAEAEGKLPAAEMRALKAEVALELGLSARLAKRLTGTTREELEADAKELLEEFPSKDRTPPPPGGRPREKQLGGGGDPNREPDESDPRKLAAAVPRR